MKALALWKATCNPEDRRGITRLNVLTQHTHSDAHFQLLVHGWCFSDKHALWPVVVLILDAYKYKLNVRLGIPG